MKKILGFITVSVLVCSCAGAKIKCTHYAQVPVTTTGTNGVPYTITVPVCDSIFFIPKQP